jgi:predicted pyridoxine 5'-phosphate oxidase superfamily flavin-nucleotide-binding protein
LKEFIEGYHTHSGSRQTVDDAFCSFVWSLIVQKPTVVVGTLPAGADVDVAVAPQARKGKKGEEGIADAPRLQLLDAKSVPFAELIAQSGDALRLAADPETTFAAITGSHIRVRLLVCGVHGS